MAEQKDHGAPAQQTPASEIERLSEIIGYYLASVVSGNNQPDMSGDPRKRIPPVRRRHFDDSCRACAEAIIAREPSSPRSGQMMVAKATPEMVKAAYVAYENNEIISRSDDWLEAVINAALAASPRSPGEHVAKAIALLVANIAPEALASATTPAAALSLIRNQLAMTSDRTLLGGSALALAGENLMKLDRRVLDQDAEIIHLRAQVERARAHAKTMRNSSKLVGPLEYAADPKSLKVWQRALYHEGKQLMEILAVSSTEQTDG